VLIRLPNTAAFIGAGVSIVLSGLVTVFADEKALLGLCVGLLGTVIAFQVDALARFERRADREDRLALILRDTEDDEWVLGEFESISAAVRAIGGNDLFRRAAQQTLSETASFFERAGMGTIESAVNYRDLVTLVNGTRHSIRANSLSRSERGFWREQGRAYWDANVDALARGVAVERVFVYAEPDEEFDRVSALQAAAGVDVRRVEESRLAPDLVEHMLILDGLWSQEIPLGRDDRAKKYVYSVKPADIAAAIRAFERVQDEAAKLPREVAVAELQDAGLTVPDRVVPTGSSPRTRR
jgi:hypothetical protein